MLLPRLTTAIIGIPLIILSIKFGGIPYFLLIFIIVIFSLQEYIFLTNKAKYENNPVIIFISGILFFISIYLNGSNLLSETKINLLTSSVLSFIIFIIFFVEIFKKKLERNFGRIGINFINIFFICWPMGHLLLIRDIKPYGNKYSYFLFVLIWLIDTGAYLVGKKFGKTRLAEKISPKKTIEGLIGGFITAIISGIVLIKLLKLDNFNVTETIILSLIITIFAVIGDLSESLLKREAEVKNSDSLLPGHGGMLDRFDSFIFTAPLFYYYLLIFK